MPSSLMLGVLPMSLIPSAPESTTRTAYRATSRTKRSPSRPRLAEHNGISPARPVLDLCGRPQGGELGAQPSYIRAQRLLRQVAVVPRLDQQPVRRDEAG